VANGAADIGSTANRYQILAKLAVGGMAEIFLARGGGVAGIERYCVLKRIRSKHASDAQFVEMFIDEARLAAQLQHPNIASVYDVGMLGDSYFFTMEYVHGQTVQSLMHRAIQTERPLPLACVLTVIANAAAGLRHAHERLSSDGRPLGIVHRDVSPSNLMVSYEGNVKLVDFGVAKAADRGVESRAGTVKGKIGYLSPEQCRGTPVDRRSDLFSLGIVMWEMLTGIRLYKRASDFETMAAIVSEPAPPPSSRRADVPRAVDAIVSRLLAKSMAERFQTAAEVVEAIEHASMRAATLLSTSAVSRLLQDLFGAPPEPWLELDGDTIPFQTATPRESSAPETLDRASIEEVEHALAAAPDLTTPMADARSGWMVPALVQAAPVVRPALPSPVAAPARASPIPPSGAATVIVPRLHAGAAAASSAVSAEPVSSDPEPGPHRRSGSSPPNLETTTRRATVVPGARISWPLVTVIATAVVIGVSAVWLSTRGEPPRAPARAVALPVAAESEIAGATDAPRAKPVNPVVAPVLPDAKPPPVPPLAVEARAAPEPVPPARSPRRPPEDAVAAAPPARTPAASPARTPPTGATRSALKTLYQNRDYARVVVACGRASVTADIARLCVLAACYQHDASAANRWFAACPPEQRHQLVASCRQVGTIDLATPALDCLKNPLDCR
jgi:serine/threonine-protein kinase